MDNHRQRTGQCSHSYSHNQHQNESNALHFFDVHYIVRGVFWQVIQGADPEIIAQGQSATDPAPASASSILWQAYVHIRDLTTQIIHTLCVAFTDL